MSFLINILSKVFNKFVGTTNNEASNSNSNLNVTRQENTNSIADATAAILWVCAFFLVIQYGVATYFWVESCIAHKSLVDFSFNNSELIEIICSLLGLGVVGTVHKFVKRK